MARQPITHPESLRPIKPILTMGCVMVAIFLCVGKNDQSALGQPLPIHPKSEELKSNHSTESSTNSELSSPWKHSIKRPYPDWDYNGDRILGHVGHDICLWDAVTGKLIHTLKDHQERIEKVQFSPDGKYAFSSSWIRPGPMLAKESRDTRTILWDLETGRKKHSFEGQVGGEFSPDGKHMVTFSQLPLDRSNAYGGWKDPETGKTLQFGIYPKFDAAVWDVSTGRELVKIDTDGEFGNPGLGNSLFFLPAGPIVSLDNAMAILYEPNDGRKIGELYAKKCQSFSCDVTSNGALGWFDRENKIILADIKSGETLRSVKHDQESIWRFAWVQDGSKAVEVPNDGAIKIWDMRSGKVTTGPNKYFDFFPSSGVIVSPDNRRLAIESNTSRVEPRVMLCDMKSGREIASIPLAKWASLLGFSPDSKTFLVGGPEFVIYNSEDGKKIRSLKLLDDVDGGRWNNY